MPYKDPQSAKAYYWKNRVSILKKMRYRYLENPFKILIRNKQWRLNNSHHCVVHAVKYEKERRHSDPNFRLRRNLRARIQKFVSGKTKSSSTMGLVGCTLPELRIHLEQQFKPGMTWENYGSKWHIDHKRPCASFDLSDPAQQRDCFNFKNLQPLWAEENLRKGSKYEKN